MSSGHGEPPSDVRSFLPRPGEPVEEYAERLRALHRDLTLVLQAVERGLAAAAEPADVPPPVPAVEPGPAPEAYEELIPVHPAGPEPASEGARPARPLGRRGARVEVLPPPTGESRRDDDEDRRRPDPPMPLPVETARPEPRFHPSDAPRPAPRFPARPSDADVDAPPRSEPEWIERAPAPAPPSAPVFPAAPPPAPAPQGIPVTRAMIAAFVVAWAIVVALLVASLLA